MAESSNHKTAPGPRGHFLLGNLPELQRNPVLFYLNAWREFGDVVRFQGLLSRSSWFLISHPYDVEDILMRKYRNYIKGKLNERFQLMLGEGLLTSEGDYWIHQRHIIQPAFHQQRVNAIAGIVTDLTNRMLDTWRPFAESSKPFDVAGQMKRLALEVVGKALFSSDSFARDNTVALALDTALEHAAYRSFHLFAPPERIPTPRNRRFAHAMRTLNTTVQRVIDERRRTGANSSDLLCMLLSVRDEETGDGLSNKQVRDEMITMLHAGEGTVASALSWTWYMLSKYPAVTRRLHSELAEVLGGRIPTAEDIPSLEYTRMVIQESLRLYPPAWAVVRQALKDDTIRGYHIPAGSPVVISQYVTHRHLDSWKNPEGFDPDRFGNWNSASSPRCAYFPFGAGPRLCIADRFAMMEMQLILATIAQRYHLNLTPGYTVEAETLLDLVPGEGIMMTLYDR